MKRRDFLKRTATGVAAAGLVAGRLAGLVGAAPVLPKRKLGNTGWEATVHGFGTMNIPDDGYEAIMDRLMELGVNYVDTAYGYEGGNCERKLGTIVPKYRDRIFLATKWPHGGPPESFVASLDESLRRMKVDSVDLIQTHMCKNADMINDERVLEGFGRVKQAGKARFLGFTSHENIVDTCNAGIANGNYACMLIKNGPLANQQFNLDPVIKKAHDAGMGVIAMKCQEGDRDFPGSEKFRAGGVSLYAARVKWVLSNPNITTLITNCVSLAVAEENTKAAMQEMTEAEEQAIREYLALAKPYVCTGCGQCTRLCPRGVKVADILRYEAYATGHRQPAQGRELYAKLPRGQTFAACNLCGICEGACPNGLRVMDRLKDAHRVLA